MHPIERLRYVARAGAVDDDLLVREAAAALASLGDDPHGMVTASRRLLDRHPTSGPLWWLASCILTAGDPVAEAWRAADAFGDDPTAREVVLALPDDATVTVVGWPSALGAALPRRGDLEVLVVDAFGEGAGLVRRLEAADVDAVDVPERGAGAAAAASAVVVLEALAMGPTGFLATPGSRAVAAVGRQAGASVWLVAGLGRALPPRVWEAVTARLRPDDPWDADVEVVPLEVVDTVIGPDGAVPPEEAARRSDCPVAPELLKDVG